MWELHIQAGSNLGSYSRREIILGIGTLVFKVKITRAMLEEIFKMACLYRAFVKQLLWNRHSARFQESKTVRIDLPLKESQNSIHSVMVCGSMEEDVAQGIRWQSSQQKKRGRTGEQKDREQQASQ